MQSSDRARVRSANRPFAPDERTRTDEDHRDQLRRKREARELTEQNARDAEAAKLKAGPEVAAIRLAEFEEAMNRPAARAVGGPR